MRLEELGEGRRWRDLSIVVVHSSDDESKPPGLYLLFSRVYLNAAEMLMRMQMLYYDYASS